MAKLRLRCNADTQILAHVREKEFMLENIIEIKTAELERCTDEMSMARNEVNRQKTDRDNLRKSFNNLSQSCGLLDKPDLLADFDKVQATIAEREQQIKNMRDAIAQTKAKMSLAEKELAQISGSKSKAFDNDSNSSASSGSKLPWVRNGVPIKRLQNKNKKK